MEYESKILNLFKNSYLTTKDVNDNNIHRFYLTKLIKEGKIERVSRGVYIKKSGYNGSLQKEDNVNLFYTKRELLDLGVINYKLDSGNIIRVYDLDKTICDIIKNKKKIDAEIFNKAIRKYFYSKKKNTLKLYEYAKKMNIYNKVRDTFEVFG